MAKGKRMGNEEKKLWQEGDESSKTKGTMIAKDLVVVNYLSRYLPAYRLFINGYVTIFG